jgi:membrane associated rhomboid family serine protease
MTRVRELMATTPLATLCSVGLCTLVYLYQVVDGPELTNYTLCARNVLYLHEFYRVITSGLFHGGMMHIGMNMMSTLAVGGLLERTYGTLQLACTILWGLLLVPAIELTAAYVLDKVFGYEHLMYQHSVGFSGVLFQLSVLEANLNPHGSRSVFGVCKVSSKAYPWAMLVALQFILPQVSFWGHLSGILVGTLQLHGCFRNLFPSTKKWREMEQWPIMQPIQQRANYIAVPNSSVDYDHDNSNSSTPWPIFASILGLGYILCNLIRNVGQTLRYIIFGNVGSISDPSNNLQQRQATSEDDEEDIELQAALVMSMQRDDESND